MDPVIREDYLYCHNKTHNVPLKSLPPVMCSQSPFITGITAERFYPDFENKILATQGEGLGAIVVLFLAGWSWIIVYLIKKKNLWIITRYPVTGVGVVCRVLLAPGRSSQLLAVTDFRCFPLFGISSPLFHRCFPQLQVWFGSVPPGGRCIRRVRLKKRLDERNFVSKCQL